MFVEVGVEDWMVENIRAEMRVYSQLDAPFLPRVIVWAEGETPPAARARGSSAAPSGRAILFDSDGAR